MHAWLLSPQVKSEMKPSQNCVTVLSGLFFFFSRQVLAGCDFNMAGGLEGMSKKTHSGCLWQSEELKLEMKHTRNIHI